MEEADTGLVPTETGASNSTVGSWTGTLAGRPSREERYFNNPHLLIGGEANDVGDEL